MGSKIVIEDIAIGPRKEEDEEYVHVKYKAYAPDYAWENEWYWKLEELARKPDPIQAILTQGYTLYKQNREEHFQLIEAEKKKLELKRKLLELKGKEITDVEKLVSELES